MLRRWSFLRRARIRVWIRVRVRAGAGNYATITIRVYSVLGRAALDAS